MVAATRERTSGKLGYRPSLDALRAISVIAVVLYHAGIPWMPGGFLGVEVFFVVSGFLITTLLVEERHHTGAISLRNFWFRRARRLLPALYLLLIVVPGLALVFYRDAVSRLGGDVIAALLYVSNWWQIFLDESYFEQAGRPPLLRHLWSLAVEEQFYILFPIFFAWMLKRHGRLRTRNVLIGMSIGSAVWMAYLYSPDTDPSRVYYGTDTRLSGLLLGAVLALIWSPWRTRGQASRSAGPMLDISGALALGGVIWFFLRVNEWDPFIYRGGFLLLDVICIVLIATLVHPASRLSKLMGIPPLVWIGMRSYSIYLWHWPIFVVTRPGQDISLTGWPLFVLRITLTLVVAEISFRYVETPVRAGAIGKYIARMQSSPTQERIPLQRNFLLGVAGLGTVILLIAGGLIVASGNEESSDADELAQAVLGDAVSATTVAPSVDTGPTSAAPGDPPASAPAETIPISTETYPTNAVAVGDSVMLGAAGTMGDVMPGIRVDAAISRQFIDVVDAVEWFDTSDNMPGPAIVQFGNNGITREGRLVEMLESLGDRKIIVVNAKVARPWEREANRRTEAAAAKFDNVIVVDWYSVAAEHPEYMVSDGTHLTKEGMRVYSQMIGSEL